jgi:uncharacterized protein (DUF427 family)
MVMAERVRKEPGSNHPIAVEPSGERIRILVDGLVVADSRAALVLREADYPPVYYLPRVDVTMDRLQASRHRTWCPYKGEAGYYGILANGRLIENAVWTYEKAFPAVAPIEALLAFYPSRVDAIEVGSP